MSKPETIMIDDVKYVREDSIADTATLTHDGMDYCIVRSRDQGVMCGYVESIDGRTVKLHQARQVWRYDSTFVLVDIAEHGMRDPEKAQLSVAASNPVYMLEACGVITCTAKASQQLIGIKAQSK
jgi:hypothetical protein